jgi:endo-1,4-beta-xylanase
VGPLLNGPKYGEVLAREFNLVSVENAMKFGPIHPEPDGYDFAGADAIVAFAGKHGLKVHSHVLVWHAQQPAWLTGKQYTREELMTILRDHIRAVAGRYRDKVAYWDVVNEAVEGDGSLRNTFWLRAIGPDYIELAFHWAHEADPKARLFYNDFGAEGLNKKSDAIYEMVKDLRARGVPIHGVGLQMHTSLRQPPDPKQVAANIKRLNDLGLEAQITEMDVQIQNVPGTLEEKLEAQARVYREILEVCLAAKNCKAFGMWGFTDRHSWIPGFTGHPDAPLIFDENYNPKPAYHALASALGAPARTGATAMQPTMQTFTYKQVGDCQIKADVYTPAPDKAKPPFPVILSLHGGALIGGGREHLSEARRARYLDSGFALVCIDYRLAPETKLPGIIEDLQDACRWIREKGPALFGADPDRLAVIGYSAGGYLTLMAGCCVEPRPKALVSFYGYGDIVGPWYSRPDPGYCKAPAVSKEEAYRVVGKNMVCDGESHPQRGRFYLYCRQQGLWPKEVSGHDPDAEPEFFVPYCPERNVTPEYPPTFLLHGDKDGDVPYHLSVTMAEALARAGVEHQFITIPNGPHGFDFFFAKEPVVIDGFERELAFLKKHLK